MRRALAFLTPFGRTVDPDPGSLLWFPLIGAVLGALLGTLWWALHGVLPPAVAAALVVAADLVLTRANHLDGLENAADGLLSFRGTRDGRLEAMQASRAAPTGLVAAGVVLVVRWLVLTASTPSVLLVTGVWAASRGTVAVVALSVPYARRQEGLASVFLDTPPPTPTGDETPWLRVRHRRSSTLRRKRSRSAVGAVALVVSLAALLGWNRVGATVTLGAGLVTAWAVVLFARHRVGGLTADVLGTVDVLSETAALAMALVW